MKKIYYTYNIEGVVTKHHLFISALMKAIFQSLIFGINSNIDKEYHKEGCYRQILFIKGWKPFKFLVNNCLKNGGRD